MASGRFALSGIIAVWFVVAASLQKPPSAVQPPAAGTARTRLTWYGHSAFRLVTPAQHVVLIDPWITNPSNPHGKQDVADLKDVDLILISHGHADHVGDALDILRRTEARVVTSFDQAQAYRRHLGFPAERVDYDSVGNVGGTLSFFDGEVKVTLVNAVHGSSLSYRENRDVRVEPAGNPVGFVISVRNGPTVYHTGDTDVFGDMRLIGELHRPDIALLPIGGHYTMGPREAAKAVELLGVKHVIPIHYGTFPLLSGTPDQFRASLAERGLGDVTVYALEPGGLARVKAPAAAAAAVS